MSRIEKYKEFESTNSPWELARRWAVFGELAAVKLTELCANQSENEIKLSVEIREISEKLIKGIDSRDRAAVEMIALEWESPSLDDDGLSTCYDVFSGDKQRLTVFHATEIGQMHSIGYADKELGLPIEVVSRFRHLVQDVKDSLDEIYQNDLGTELERCLYE